MAKTKKCLVCSNLKFKDIYSNSDRMFNTKRVFNIVKCTNCGLLSIDPQPTKNILSKHYPKQNYYSYKADITGLSGLISKFRSYLVRHYYQPTFISKLFSKLIKGVPGLPTSKPKGSRILDVGCGTGQTLAILKDLGWEVYGLEIDKKAVKIARERGLQNVKLGDYTKLASYPDNYFDCIRLYHVIEHLDDPKKCLGLIFKKLKPKAEVILGTPNTDSTVARVFKQNWYNLDTPRHLFVFSKSNLAKLLKSQKFSRLSTIYCSSDGLGRSIIYSLNAKLGLNLNTNKFTFLFIVLYPVEWTLDKLSKGDIITIRAIKTAK